MRDKDITKASTSQHRFLQVTATDSSLGRHQLTNYRTVARAALTRAYAPVMVVGLRKMHVRGISNDRTRKMG